MTEIAVVIPTHNHADLVPEAVDSVLAQTEAVSEIIVVDDGSTDDTRDRLRRYSSDIKYVYQPNRGLSAARNRGIAECRAEWIAFLDADDLWLSHKLKEQLPLIEVAQDDVGCVHSRALIKGPGYQVPSPLPPGGGELLLHHLARQNHVAVLTAVVRREILLKLGGFSETLTALEDWDLWLRLAAAGYGFRYSPKVLAIYRVSLGAMHMDAEKMERNARRVLGNFFSTPGLPPSVSGLSNISYALFYLGLSRTFAFRHDRKMAIEYVRKALSCRPGIGLSGSFLGSTLRIALPRFMYDLFRTVNRRRLTKDARGP